MQGKAVSANITVVPEEPLGYLTAWPTGQPQPYVSTLNSLDGRIVANATIVPTGTSSQITVFATNRTHVIVDLNGHFDTAGQYGSAFYALTPCRMVDTRNADGPFGGPILAAGITRIFSALESQCGIALGAHAYAFNVTVVPRGPLGFVTLWSGGPRPLASTLNSLDGRILANAAIVPAADGGQISIYTTDQTHVILDLVGYFGP
jgi:hypothetical protein